MPPRPSRSKGRILVAEDDASTREGLTELLQSWGYSVETVPDGDRALEAIEKNRPMVVLSDLMMPGRDAISLLEATQKLPPPHPNIIILTAYGTVESAVAAMAKGAYFYITKPIEDGQTLRAILARAQADWETEHELEVLKREKYYSGRVGDLLGQSQKMREVFRLIEQVAPTEASVLLLGESGTGKDLVATTIHSLSPRKNEAFVALNCAAIPETLLESEILGHEKGAFTGALTTRAGCFELADRGTLFLDEIAEMAPALQAKLLRVLEDQTIRRVGGKIETKVDVRVLAATNRPIEEALEKKLLREDLYYRLNVFTIHLPTLGQRPDDIPVLANAFLQEFAKKYKKNLTGIEETAMRQLVKHPWPGNVRELRNYLERASIVAEPPLVRATDLPPLPTVGTSLGRSTPTGAIAGKTIDAVEKELILATLSDTNQNKTRAADLLGISLKTLHNKLRRYRMESAGAEE